MTTNRHIVAIDGPSGVGKSSVSRVVANELGYTYLDTGAMYRGVGLYCFERGLDGDEEEQITPLLADIKISLQPAESVDEDVTIFLNGEDVSEKIRTPQLSMIASKISALPTVRGFLTEMQRHLAEKGRVVAEGRDMGTVVFPHAAYKFFLDADAKERAVRRVKQLQQKGMKADEQQILDMIVERDKNDSQRAVAPLKRAEDAVYINTTALSLDQVCEKILTSIRK